MPAGSGGGCACSACRTKIAPGSMRFAQPVRLRAGDNPLYVRLTQEDGHQAWSSPIYAIAG